jgi:diguanylate cyclase (GGDEF)-like protein
VAEVVATQLGGADRLVRYGGDEYVVILPGQGSDVALTKAERMKDAIAGGHFLTEQGLDVRVSASFGLATYPDDATDKKGLLMAADQCLFHSKAAGKNRVARPTRDAVTRG